jgi:dTDP-4-amino-4,6-dideoxygalactose transaminase
MSNIKNNEIDIKIDGDNFISNFAYPIVSKNKTKIIEELIKNEIEVRPLIAGNMSKKPMWYENYGFLDLPNCEKINEFGFYVPNHQNLKLEEIKKICKIINNG